MLKKIIQVMLTANMIHKPELARRVGVQPETLEDMLRLLLERGMLRVGECAEISDSHCSGCSSASNCNSIEHESISYYVTEKGKKYAIS